MQGSKPESSRLTSSETSTLLDHLGVHLGRSYYSYLQLVTGFLQEFGLHSRLKPGMSAVLFVLWEHDDQRIGQITERLGLSKSTMTRLIRSMEGAGYVTTDRDKSDRRSIRVKLTKEAHQIREEAIALAVRVESTVTKDLAPKEAKMLRELLKTVHATITGFGEAPRSLSLPE